MPTQITISNSFIVNTVEDGVTYKIESSVGSVTIASDATTGTLTTTLSFFKKEGDGNYVPFTCYCTLFRKKGDTYTLLRQYSNSASSVT